MTFPAIARPLSLTPESLRAEICMVNAFPQRDLHFDPRQPLEIRPRRERRSEQEQ